MQRCSKLIAIASFAILAPATAAVSGDRNAKPDEPQAAVATDRLVIHEWGTFTSLQDEAGRPLAAINTDDEPVPEFVHRISNFISLPSQLAPVYCKGVPISHRDVCMRLETPVVYFHPPRGQRQPLHATVEVGFHGGWLTEFYPAARVSAPGLRQGSFRFGSLTPQTLGTLAWHDITISPIDSQSGALPETTEKVWLTPRQVRAATVSVPGGEAEKYLFYRGVGNVPSPINVTRTPDDDGLIVHEQVPAHLELRGPLSIRAMWLVHVREDGSVAFRSLGGADLTGKSGRELARSPVAFATPANSPVENASTGFKTKPEAETLLDSYSPKNLAALHEQMHGELVADGLYADEADAMLNTWESAYFKSPGLRLFYLVPRQWTDAILPLHCSVPAEFSRTMVGRIELVTPRQRTLLKRLATESVAKSNWLYATLEGRSNRNQLLGLLWDGKARFQELGLPVPPEYQSYIDLGRFRNALILDELTRNPKSGIGRFARAYHVKYYTPEDGESETATTSNE